MKTNTIRSLLRQAALGLAILACTVLAPASAQPAEGNDDGVVIRRAFAAWARGTGGPFELLSDDMRWTIVGRSAVAGTYEGRADFMDRVIHPFNARMKSPLRPVVHRIHQDGDRVIVLFDARGVATDGVVYENTYTWHLTMADGRIVDAIAFFDSIAFDELWTRVVPAAAAP